MNIMTKGRALGWMAIFRSYIGSHWWASTRKRNPSAPAIGLHPSRTSTKTCSIDTYKFSRVSARKAYFHNKRTGAMSPAHQPIDICMYIHTYTPIYKHISCMGTTTWAFDVIVGLIYNLQSKNIYHVCFIPRHILTYFDAPYMHPAYTDGRRPQSHDPTDSIFETHRGHGHTISHPPMLYTY